MMLCVLKCLNNFLFSLASWLAQPRSFAIENANQSIDLIIQSVGYLDSISFRKLFRKKTGLTPLEYRCRFSRRVSAFQLNLA